MEWNSCVEYKNIHKGKMDEERVRIRTEKDFHVSHSLEQWKNVPPETNVVINGGKENILLSTCFGLLDLSLDEVFIQTFP